MAYWLMKTEPETFSYEQLVNDGKTGWNGVRNFQARNFLKQMKKDDLALIYHSGDSREVVGISKVVREAYPDYDEDGKEWVQVDVVPVKKLKNPVTLSMIKSIKMLSSMLLIKQSRLSVMPITAEHYKKILELAK